MSIYITCLYCLIITIMGLGCTSHQKKRFYEHNVSESVMTYPILTCKHKMFLWSFWKTCYNTHHLSPFRIPFILNRQHTNRQIPSKRPCKQSIFPAFSQYWNMVACNPCTKFWHFFGATNTGIFLSFDMCLLKGVENSSHAHDFWIAYTISHRYLPNCRKTKRQKTSIIEVCIECTLSTNAYKWLKN